MCVGVKGERGRSRPRGSGASSRGSPSETRGKFDKIKSSLKERGSKGEVVIASLMTVGRGGLSSAWRREE